MEANKSSQVTVPFSNLLTDRRRIESLLFQLERASWIFGIPLVIGCAGEFLAYFVKSLSLGAIFTGLTALGVAGEVAISILAWHKNLMLREMQEKLDAENEKEVATLHKSISDLVDDRTPRSLSAAQRETIRSKIIRSDKQAIYFSIIGNTIEILRYASEISGTLTESNWIVVWSPPAPSAFANGVNVVTGAYSDEAIKSAADRIFEALKSAGVAVDRIINPSSAPGDAILRIVVGGKD